MKHDLDKLNLRDAFRPMPDEIRDKLLQTAGSVKEDENVKRAAFRTLLLAACIIIATMSVVLAASSLFGWNDFFQQFYGVTIPDAVQQIMKDTGETTYTLGKVTFTVSGLYCDGEVATASTTAKLADGIKALLTGDDPFDAIGANGENGEKAAEALGIDPSLSWAEAARQLKLPLYSVRAILEIPDDLSGGESMEDVLFGEDGTLTYFSMAMMNGQANGDTVPCKMFLRVLEVNPEDMENQPEALQEWKDITLPLSKPISTRMYIVPDGVIMDDAFRLEEVQAVQMPGGVNVISTVTALSGAAEDQAEDALSDLEPVQENGEALPGGLNLTGNIIDMTQWPKIKITRMVTLDHLPASLTMAIPTGGDEVTTMTLPSTTLNP